MFSRRMTAALLFALLAATGTSPTQGHILHSTEDSEVQVVSNPHCSRSSSSSAEEKSRSEKVSVGASSCSPSFLLSPHRIIRTPMATQPDTLIEVTTKKVLSVPVPIYHFQQPTRISPLALPFKLILVSDVDTALRTIPVDPAVAADSWFLGYSWEPVVYAEGCDGPVHVGWKFSNAAQEFFYALIVDAKDEEKVAVRVSVGSLGESIAESLSIGTRAPGWMMDILTKI